MPTYIGIGAWGLGGATSAWWAGPEYYNPYYTPVATTSATYYYDYSQPVAVYDYNQPDDNQQ